MRKRFMVALLCLCLLTGGLSAAYATASEDDSGSGSDSGTQSTVSFTGELADNLDSTTNDGKSPSGSTYKTFNEAADVAYEKGIDIYAQVGEAFETLTVNVYQVELVWGDMAFAYGKADAIYQKWNTEKHKYEPDTETAAQRDVEWYLINKGTPLKPKYYDETKHKTVLASTDQNYVVMFNHSDMPVNANVFLTDVNAPDASAADDNILAVLKTNDDFGADVTNSATAGYDYALAAAAANSDIYANNNAAAALYVEMDGSKGAPTTNALNDTNNRTVAKITVTFSLPTAQENG